MLAALLDDIPFQLDLAALRQQSFPNRIKRYVLSRSNFDEDDSQWLCTTISTFLVIIEGWLSGSFEIDQLTNQWS